MFLFHFSQFPISLKSIGNGVVLISGFLILNGCQSSSSISGRNMNYLYEPITANDITVQYKVWKDASGDVKLIWKIPAEMLSEKMDERGQLSRGVSFRYKIFYNYSESIALDSGVSIVSNLGVSQSGFFIDTIDLSISEKRRHVVDIKCKDLNSTHDNIQFADVDLSKAFSAINSIFYLNDGQVNFDSYVSQPGDYEIDFSSSKSLLYVKYYQREFVLASAPFAVVNPKPFNFKPDQKQVIERNESGRFVLPMHQYGLYQVSEDSTGNEGPSFHFFNQHYPQPRQIEDLLYPLRYITTTDEYRDLNAGEDLKKNVDSYWLKVAGSSSRAKELIRAYYSRVAQANSFFSSYLEGWKSDRGMCYIVYGKPDAVYRSTSSETWIYGEKGMSSSLSLTFTKVANPFTANDFRLNRSNSLKSAWYRAVEFWRQGRIITYK